MRIVATQLIKCILSLSTVRIYIAARSAKWLSRCIWNTEAVILQINSESKPSLLAMTSLCPS
uniref:Uncharacterized protein n=1 Tax=Anguilla anguilla TaxID=7936 RepID=A0A0E9S464_ANGAN